MGINWKCPFLPFIYLITSKKGFWCFRSLYIRDTVSDKTYQNFRDKKLVRPGSKYPIWQKSQSISYKAKFSQRDIQHNQIQQNLPNTTKLTKISREKLRSDRFLHHEMPKIAKNLPYNLHEWAFYKIAKFVLTKKLYQ